METKDPCETCKLYKTSCVMSYQGQFTAKKIMGVGPKDSKIMFIGEALGQEEVIQQKPFSGVAGNFLNNSLIEAGMEREKVFTSNVCKCRPPDNRAPKPAEVKCCLPFLMDEIREIKPKVICTLGATALEAILKRKGITSIRGNLYETIIDNLKIKVIPTYHPAYLTRKQELPQLKEQFIRDLKLVKRVSEEDNFKVEKKPVKYIITSNIEDIFNYIDQIKETKVFSYDIETTGFDFLKDKIISMSLSCKETEAISFKMDKFTPDEQALIFKKLKEILESKEIIKVAHNAKFDNKFLRTYGINVKLPLFDTMLAHFLIDENSLHGLKDLAYRYTDMGGYDDKLDEVFKTQKKEQRLKLSSQKRSGEISEEEFDESVNKINFSMIPDDILLPYGAGDSDCTIRLYSIFKELLEKENLLSVLNYIMMPLQIVLTNTEYEGISLDIPYMNQLESELTSKMKDIEFRILEKPEVAQTEKLINKEPIKVDGIIMGEKITNPGEKGYEKFNLNSTKHLQLLLYTVLKLNPGMKTKKGTGYSTNAQTLEILSEKSEMARLISEYRKIKHDVSTYIEQIKNNLDDYNRTHTDYMQHGSVTGRVISHRPNLQNIPRDSNVKRLFIPDKGHIMLSADYSSIEYKCWGNYANDIQMLEDIKNNLDIHSEVACYVWPHLYKKVGDRQYLYIQTKETKNKVEGPYRVKAKQVVFGLIYGRGVPSLVKELGITENEANKIIDFILNKYPKARLWLENQRKIVKRDKQVKNLFGRIRRLPEIAGNENEKVAEAIRQCYNAPIQAAASDITSIATIRVYNNMNKLGLKTRLILTIHDSLKYTVPLKELDQAVDCVVRGMCDPIKLVNFPLEMELEIGPNWKDLIHYSEFEKDRKNYLKSWNYEI